MDMCRVYHVTLVALQKQVPITFFQSFQAFCRLKLLIQSMDHRMIAETFHIDHTRPIQIKNGLINSFHVNPLCSGLSCKDKLTIILIIMYRINTIPLIILNCI